MLDPPRAIGWLPGHDWAAVPQSVHEYLQFPRMGPERLADSLHHLAKLAAPEPRA